MIRVNLHHESTNSAEEKKMVFLLAVEMAADYKLSSRMASTLIVDHLEDLAKWVAIKYPESGVSYYNFNNLSYGFEFEETAFLTALLLKVPNGKVTLS